ncbi:hypothetical protein P700755_000266 [Psychroflexus torquis ATCC 700755]|uniref:Uncharacterized protein n=1 Tax=Psychroflexus torquis (strain ATCC 700755 / CIP 106069 / ACAM 623) TaxID=313595 RepID=K4IA54_PSYTT|nr:hypothetical protein P700755_000266 [Psychroflexus torquis ATCC 700755]
MLKIGIDSSVAKCSFRMTLSKCHSDREVFFFDEESLSHSDREVFFFDEESFFQHVTFMFSTGKDSSVAKKLLQNDSGVLSFRQRSFLLRRGIFMLLIGIDSSVAKSSFRMTAAFCHSDREVFCFDEESLCFRQSKILQSRKALSE